MNTTITIEFRSDTKGHLKTLEHRLKQIHDVSVDLVEPRDHTAPVLVAIGIEKSGERAEIAAQNVAQVLYDFLHEDTGTQNQGQKTISVVTIEGDRIDIEPLSVEEIKDMIFEAEEGE